MTERSKLLKLKIENIGCIGPEGIELDLNNIICLVGSNNSGKTTVLRAYELALGKEAFTMDDFCKRSSEKKAAIELLVHIPEGTPNISEDWKYKLGDYLVVKTRWEWDENLKAIRKTWDPVTNDFAEKNKASGLDQVFYSRLPKPYRIGTLDSPDKEQDLMKKIVLQPIADKLDLMSKDNNSELSVTISKIKELAEKPIIDHKQSIDDITKNLSTHHQHIFPELSIDFSIGLSDPNIKPSDLLYKGSAIKFKEGETEIDWRQQGTGSQRAFFWSLMQVRSRIQTILEESKLKEGLKVDLEKKISDANSKLSTLKQQKTIDAKKTEIEKLSQDLDRINSTDNPTDSDISLPGYMLLIDEPEIALHPNAIRAASKYLYDLSDEPSWQVMLTTHSPIFVDPTRDHTTIIRLDRNNQNPTPKIYISEEANFSEPEIVKLKMLNRYDNSLAEMFFGQYPIIVEGDTEFTAFTMIMNNNLTKYTIAKRPIIYRARGKWTIPLVIKMLRHFKINFSVLHDSDSPYILNGNKNGVWKANLDIFKEIQNCLKDRLKVKQLISIPNFECQHTVLEKGDIGIAKSIPYKEKPWNIFEKVQNNSSVSESIEKILDNLIKQEEFKENSEEEFSEYLNNEVQKWSTKFDSDNKVLYFGNDK